MRAVFILRLSIFFKIIFLKEKYAFMLLLLCMCSMSVLLQFFFLIWRKLDDQEHAIQVDAIAKVIEK